LAALDVGRLEDRAGDALDGAVRDGQRVDAVSEAEGQSAGWLRFPGASLARRGHAGAGSTGEMKPRHRIAVAHRVIAAAFGPADHRKNTVPHRPQPCPLLTCRKSDISFCPPSRPHVFIAVEARRADPVLQCEVVTVLDAEPTLFRCIDQKQTAERPEGLAAQALFALLLD